MSLLEEKHLGNGEKSRGITTRENNADVDYCLMYLFITNYLQGEMIMCYILCQSTICPTKWHSSSGDHECLEKPWVIYRGVAWT